MASRTRALPGRAPILFGARIEARRGSESELSGIDVSGGVFESELEDAVSRMAGYLSDEELDRFRATMEGHLRRATATDEEMVEDQGAIVGSYGREEAEGWIEEYTQHLCEAFSFDLRFLVEERLANRIGIAADTIEGWAEAESCDGD